HAHTTPYDENAGAWVQSACEACDSHDARSPARHSALSFGFFTPAQPAGCDEASGEGPASAPDPPASSFAPQPTLAALMNHKSTLTVEFTTRPYRLLRANATDPHVTAARASGSAWLVLRRV